MISTQKIRDNFSRAAGHYEKYAGFQAELAQELLEEVIGGGYKADEVLDIGCGTGWLLAELRRFLPHSQLWGLDISLEMAKKSREKVENILVGDASCLPFKEQALDLVLSNAVYQWVPDLPAAFKEARRALKPGGCLLFNCFGAKTLGELRRCFGIEETFLPQADSIKEALEKAGFPSPELKVRDCIRHFDNLADILSWLKYIGVNRINQHQGLLTPAQLAKADHFYRSNFRGFGYGCGYRKPHHSPRAYWKPNPALPAGRHGPLASANGQVYASFEVITVKVCRDRTMFCPYKDVK